MDEYGRNDEMQLKSLTSAEFDIKDLFFLTALHQCPPHPPQNPLMLPRLGTTAIGLD
jgi:hypothetical protein